MLFHRLKKQNNRRITLPTVLDNRNSKLEEDLIRGPTAKWLIKVHSIGQRSINNGRMSYRIIDTRTFLRMIASACTYATGGRSRWGGCASFCKGTL